MLLSLAAVGGSQSFLLFIGGLLAANVCVIAAAWLIRQTRERPEPQMDTAGGVLVAKTPRLPFALQALGIWLMAGAYATGLFRPSDLSWFVFLAVVLGAAIAVGVILLAMAARPASVRVGADGVELISWSRRRMLSWAELESDPWALDRAGMRGVVGGSASKRGQVVDIRRLDTDPQAILDTIAFYRDNPGERTALGTIADGDGVALVRIN